jgi:Ca-activated chloride channel homolog
MKAPKVALLTLAGMIFTSFSVYSLTPPPGTGPIGEDSSIIGSGSEDIGGGSSGSTELARFTSGSTLMIEGRMGHAKVRSSTRGGESFVMLEVRGTEAAEARSTTPANLALVIDRSGSMKGTRLRNAINAASAAVEQLKEGDRVSVIAFDSNTSVIVPPTTIGVSTREQVIASIRGITLGGDTCISCGIEEGSLQLERSALDSVNRMIVLSDGDATKGVRDLPGFRSISQRARDRGISITTIGVDTAYNEKILSAIAEESNGRHYFVENDAALSKVFAAEAESLTTTVASGAEVTIELAPGVELDRVFDRSFRRSGNRISVPLGSFSGGEVKTVLLKVRIPSQQEGTTLVADVNMTYRDLVADSAGRCDGKLAVEVTGDASLASDLDPIVAGRVQRSETAAVLKEANTLFDQGKREEARQRVAAQASSLASAAVKAKSAAPADRAAEVSGDFDKQIAAIGRASSGFATPPPAARPGGGSVAADPAPATRAPQLDNEANAFELRR